MATTYYVSFTQGADTNPGTQASPWKTAGRALAVSGFSTVVVAGDTVLFRCNDVWVENISVDAALTGLTMGTYSSGAKPVIRGFFTPTSWTNNGNGTYSFTNSAFATGMPINAVTLDNNFVEIARWPKSGYRTINSHVGGAALNGTSNPSASITDNTLTTTPTNYATTGTTRLVMRKRRWVLDKAKVTAHSGGTLTYSIINGINLSYDPFNNYGYFLQNHITFLTQYGDWMYNESTKTVTMYFGSELPSSHTVRFSSLQRGLGIDAANVTVNGLAFEGQNQYGIVAGTGSSIQNCDFNFIGEYGIISFNPIHNVTINNCNFNDCPNNGITAFSCNNWKVMNCHFSRISHWAGMGGSNDTQYIACYVQGDSFLAEYNTFQNIGYDAIYYRGSGSIIRYNYIDTFCYVKDDGGAIYTFEGFTLVNSVRRTITGNIIRNGVGALAGVDPVEASKAMGVYLDEFASENDVTNNTIIDCDFGIFFHVASKNTAQGNTFYRNTHGIFFRFPDSQMNTDSVSGNIVVAAAGDSLFTLDSHTAYVTFGTATLNKYFVKDSQVPGYFKISLNEASFTNNNYTLLLFTGWKSATGVDANSTVTEYNIERLDYNTTNAPITVNLNRAYKGIDGTIYNSSIVVPPFSSVFLMAYSAASTMIIANGKLLVVNGHLALK
jgi:parallel beta-helix repeat protein